MSLNNIKKLQSQRGFTLVELLIVIVIIAILAAITIVAYNGITTRAHASAEQQAAQNVASKSEAYNAENGSYPNTMSLMSGASVSANSSFYIAPTAYTQQTAAMTAALYNAAGKDNAISFYVCSAGAGNYVGNRVDYWNPSTNAVGSVTAGATTGSVGGTAVSCAIATT